MKVTVSKGEFSGVLNTLQKVADKCCIVFNKNILHSTVCSSCNTLFAHTEIECEMDDPSEYKIYVGNLKDFNLLIKNIDSEKISLDVDDNKIVFSSKQFKFKYHLLHESAGGKIFNFNKINQLSKDFTFNISNIDVNNVIKFSAIASEDTKVYLKKNDDTLFLSVTDETKDLENSFTFALSDQKHDGEFIPVILSVESFRTMLLPTDHYKCAVNKDKKIMYLHEGFKQYALTSYVK